MKKFIKILSMIMAAAIFMMVSGCDGGSSSNSSTQTPTKKPSPTPQEMTQGTLDEKLLENKIGFTITLESGDVMKGELYPDLAPITVENFVKLAKSDFYNGLIFHRVIPGFMIQGGGYDVNFKEKEAESIKGEFAENGVKNDLKHTTGVISMARTNVKDSASSQFFIMHKDTPSLDGGYAAFGKITEGLDVIDKIATVKTTTMQNGLSDCPVEPVVIKSITIDE